MRPVRFGTPLPGQELRFILDALHDIERASQEDALTIADDFVVTNAVELREINTATCTLAQLAQFVATLVDDFQKRGQNRVE